MHDVRNISFFWADVSLSLLVYLFILVLITALHEISTKHWTPLRILYGSKISDVCSMPVCVVGERDS